jgi:hypothetical protein
VTKDADASWPYYALDFPGLSRDDAERILEWARQQGPALGSLLSGDGVAPGWIVEPEWFYARYLDKCTVHTLKKASELALASGQITDQEEIDGLTSMVEDFTEWLEQAEEAADCADD